MMIKDDLSFAEVLTAIVFSFKAFRLNHLTFTQQPHLAIPLSKYLVYASLNVPWLLFLLCSVLVSYPFISFHTIKCINWKLQFSKNTQSTPTFLSRYSCIQFHSWIFQLEFKECCIHARFEFDVFSVVLVHLSPFFFRSQVRKLLYHFFSSSFLFIHLAFEFQCLCCLFKLHLIL